MRSDRKRVERRLLVVMVAFLSGLAAIIVGILALDSRLVVGIALVWTLAAMLYAARAFRCPLCGATLLYFPVRAAWRWLRVSPRLCPRCRTDYDAAVAELARGREKST